MPGERVLAISPATGIQSTWYEDPVTGDVAVVSRQDVEPILAENARIRAGFEKHTPFGELQLMRRVPLNVWMEWQRLGIVDDEVAYRKVLNDFDNAKMQIHPGRV